ncbi:fimbrial assembly family protein [Thermoanaerobacterium thermosaccharolyticum]|uniref:Fimbrial assembly family protein n=1 Tax=Thermoanaerobacterium thermosaccharolyticum TaxID=1517 RepID=A0A231VHX9_THETR|nr:PilN domain-containing protein [Thermoanaerobacterium thermosaccharolyticum]AST59158.1 fimbrial assembly family protein [Thermoanaerobacterium thermosaccharolyticum]MCP2239328.1 type IV pilus assembly protein PilN [Thermoanaerobacterium thermosaccharolyticum]OXT07658.1 fimbrial assembly protein [Thermoanaerobacterium thermosaccharolyticum]TCW37277.1 type IV pilus assembly protein PilN [Thermohydrogenium kirishiense]
MKDINLIPEEIKLYELNRKRRTKNLIGCIAMLCIIIAILLLPQMYIHNLKSERAVLNSQLNNIKDKKDAYSELQNKMKYYLSKQSIIKKLSKKKIDITKILNDISSNIPDNVSMTDIKFSDNVIEITGDAYMNKYLSDFMLNIRKLSYVDDIDLLDTKKSDNGLIQYTLQIKLKVV